MNIKIVQISDLHLYQDPDRRLAGVQTWSTFRAVQEQVRRQHEDFDYLIITGDLAQDETLETYLMLRQALGNWVERCRIIPGNHDDRTALRQAFPELFSKSQDALTFALSAGPWRIIGLDSQVPGESKGRVDGEQLEWLKTELRNAHGNPTLIFVHHPPIAINVAWLDDIALEENTEIVQLIKTFPQVKVVCAGHVHQEFVGRIGASAVYTTPSTCVQFAARAERTFDSAMAGYRTFTLDDDGHHTEVHRLGLVKK